MKQTIRKALALFMTIALVATTITFTAGNTLQAEEQAPPEVSQETSEPAKADAPATTPEPEKSEPVTETQTMNLSQDEPDDEDYESAPADNEKKNPANEKKDNDKDKKGKKLSGSEADLYVNVADPKDALPDGASIKLREANPENIKALIQNYYGSDAEVKGVQAVDISFVKNGNKQTPNGMVNVTISGIDISGDNMALFHISGNRAEYVKEVSGTSVSFSAGSFSPYAIASYVKIDSNKSDAEGGSDDVQNMSNSGPKTVYVGKNITLTSDKGNDYHEWTSSDYSKATVSGAGKSVTVTGVAAAKNVTITHKYYEKNGNNYSKKSETFTVTVLANGSPSTGATSLTLDKTSVMLNTIGATETVRATTSGLNDDEFVTWTSSNEKVATVNNGVITAVDEGNATVTATVTHYGENDEPVVLSKTVNVTVKFSGKYNLYYYALIPGHQADTGNADADWLGLGVSTIKGAPNPNSLSLGTQISSSSFKVPEPGNVKSLYPDITIKGVTYTYAAPGSGNETNEGYYTLSPYRVVVANGANAGNNGYNNTVNAGINTYHWDFVMNLNTPGVYTVNFAVDYPGDEGFEALTKYATRVNGGTRESTITKPSSSDVPSSMSENGISYNFDGWYLDEACTQKADFSGTSQGNTTYYGKYNPVNARYSVEYYYDGVLDISKTETKIANIGTVISNYQDKALTGYSLDKTENLPLTVKADSSENVIKIYYVKRTHSYTVEHYLQNVNDDEYTMDKDASESKTGIVGEKTAAEAKSYTGFTAREFNQVTIAAEGTTVVKIYYDRNVHKVTYEFTGTVPTEASTVPSEENYRYGAIVTVADAATAPGYTFSGWSRQGSFEMQDEDITITGSFSANTNTAYKVEHYQQNLDGTGYNLADTENCVGTTGSEVTATAKSYEGFTYKDDIAGTVKTGTIAGNGSLVLKLYYDRNSYRVRYEYEGAVPEGATDLPSTVDYKYGAEVTVAAASTAPGYTFSGWNRTGIFNMPAEDVVISGTFTANGDTAYKVEHYKQNLADNGYTLADTDNRTGTTGAEATAIAKTYPGFTYDETFTGNVKTGTITGDGNLVLKLYYDRNSYKVSYTYENNVPGMSTLPAESTVKFGANVKVATKATALGYTFNGWRTDDVAVSDGAFTMPANDVVFKGSFAARSDTAYTVKHYTEKLDGSYELANTENKRGTTGAPAVAEPKSDYTGFVWDNTVEGTLQSGTIAGDGSLVLKLYYKRVEYSVSYTYSGDIPGNVSSLPEKATYKYGLSVSIAQDASATGYVFNGWTTDDTAVSDGAFTMPAKDVTITGSFSPATNTQYTVCHLQETTEGTYILVDSETQYGTTGALTNAAEKQYDNFTAKTFSQQTIAANGSTIIEIEYDRNAFPVTYSYTGEVPTGAEEAPDGSNYKFDKIVDVAGSPTAPAGYTFSGWKTSDANVTDGKFTMPTKAVSFTGSFSANTNTAYTVEHYKQKLDGDGYTLADTDNCTGTTGTPVTATANDYPGFTYNKNVAGTVRTGTIAGDGSLVLKLYYDRNSYKVTYKYNNEEAVPGATDLPEEATYLYDSEVTVAAAATAPGYTFSGWNRTGTFNMPAENVTISGTFTAKGDTKYKVQHYLQNVDGSEYSLEETVEASGATGTTATANPKNYEGFTLNEKADGYKAEGKIAGDGSLVLKLYYDRNSYKVTYKYNNEEAVPGATDLPKEAAYLYGSKVEVAEAAAAEGYVFNGWMLGDKKAEDFEMPAKDITIIGSFSPATDTKYTVEHLVWNGSEYKVKATDNLKGTTGATAEAEANSIPGYTYYEGSPNEVKSDTIKPDGSTVLKLYYKKNVTVTVSGTDTSGVVYDGKMHYAEGKAEADFEKYDISNATFGESSEIPAVEGKNAGTYTSELKAEDCVNNDSNCEVTFVVKPWSLNIIRKVISIKPDDKQKVYGNPDPEFSGEVSGIVEGDEAGINVEYLRLDNSESVGEYNITAAISGEAAGNYIAETGIGTLKINKRQITITSASATKQYDGLPLTAPSVEISGMGLAEGDSLIVSFGEGQTEVGKSDNVFTEVIVRNNVAMALSSADSEIPEYAIMSDNYDVQKIYGVLTVTEVAAAGAENVNPDGNADGNGDGNGDGGQVIRVTNDDNGNYNVTTIGDGQTPLAKNLLDLNCCILHLLIMLAAMLVLLWYTHDMKKRQRKIFELEEQLTEME